MELMLSIAVIATLVAVMFAMTNGLRKRAEAAACMANLKSLFAGLATYTLDHKGWPQPSEDVLGEEEEFWKFWMNVLKPYDIPEETWVCPTHARLENQNYDFKHGSYLPAGFDNRSAQTPYRWNQPWLMETGNNHGRGPLVIYPDGSIRPFSIVPERGKN